LCTYHILYYSVLVLHIYIGKSKRDIPEEAHAFLSVVCSTSDGVQRQITQRED
jgi:hypothetical protein